MRPNDARGSVWGLLAAAGYIFWIALLLNTLINLGALLAFSWAGVPYALAFGMGICGLVIVLHGSGRALARVRFDRRMEFPPEVEVADQR